MESTKEALGQGQPLSQASKANLLKVHGYLYKQLEPSVRRTYEAKAYAKNMERLNSLTEEREWLKASMEIEVVRANEELATGEDPGGEALLMKLGKLTLQDIDQLAD
eukprot:8710955-Lingulodinium_polyedra.AAC.1